MSISSKTPDGEYVKLSPGARVQAWKWWFIVLLLLAVAAAVWTLTREFRTARSLSSLSFSSEPVAVLAFVNTAATNSTGSSLPTKDSDLVTKTYVMIGILGLIGIVILVCLGVSLFSQNEHAVSTASDMLKTCIGFFIGIATSYFGATH
jgi:hypothetical protein